MVDGNPPQSVLERIVRLLGADLHELLPTQHTLLLGYPNVLHNGLQVRQLGLDGEDLVELLRVLDDYDVGAGGVRDVLADLRRVGGVYAARYAAGKDGAGLRYEPLGGVEPDDADGVVPRKAELYEGLGGDSRVLEVLGSDSIENGFARVLDRKNIT